MSKETISRKKSTTANPKQSKSENNQPELKAVLCEYEALRAEILQKFNHHMQIYSIVITASTLMIGYILREKVYDLLLAVPIISSALALRLIWEQRVIIQIGEYLKSVEENVLPAIIGYRVADNDNLQRWVNWEHYFREHLPHLFFYKLAVLLVFVIIPILPAIIFSILILAKYYRLFNMPIESGLPILVHFLAPILFGFLSYFLSSNLWRE